MTEPWVKPPKWKKAKVGRKPCSLIGKPRAFFPTPEQKLEMIEHQRDERRFRRNNLGASNGKKW
jgi:hypothetical protein